MKRLKTILIVERNKIRQIKEDMLTSLEESEPTDYDTIENFMNFSQINYKNYYHIYLTKN